METATATAEPKADGSVSLETASEQLFGTRSNESQSTPPTQSSPGQASAAPGTGEGAASSEPQAPTSAAPDQGQAEGEPTAEDLLAAMGPTETQEEQLARTKREAGASRAEALRLKKVEDGLKGILKNQNLDLVLDDDGNVAGIAPNDKYNGGKAADAIALKFTDLSSEDQDRFESDPQALIDHVLGMAKTGLARVAPTVDKPVASLSPEAEETNFDYLANLVLEDGETKKHPNLTANKPIMKQLVNAPSNKALKEFFSLQPELAIALLDSHVDKTRQLLAARAQISKTAQERKQQEADSTISTAPANGGAPVISSNATPEEAGTAWGKAIAAADF